MKFETPIQKACYEKIQPWLQDLYENVYSPPYDTPVFVLPLGSATANVEVLPWGNSEAIISTWSYVVTGAEITQDLMRFLLKKMRNYNLVSLALMMMVIFGFIQL